MTTIATDGRSMAADGLVCCGDCITDADFIKIARLPDGSLIGGCGSAYSNVAFREWLADQDRPKPELEDTFEALVLLPNGEVISYNHRFQSLQEPKRAAIGSGMRFALAAMDAGCSPMKAVGIAAGRDTQTGGTIMEMEISV